MENVQTKKSYEEALLQRWQNFAISTNRGWIFAKVLNYEDAPLIYDRYDAVSGSSGTTTIAGGSSAEYHKWEDKNDNDLFYETQKDKALQVFIGIYPLRLRLFRAMPNTVKRGRLDKIIVGTLSSTSPGWIDGRDSPFDIPGVKSEMIVPPKMRVEHGVFNPESFSVMPRFNVKIRRLDVKWFDPDNTVQAKKIDEMISGKEKCHFWSPGIEAVEYNLNNIGVSAVDVVPSLGFTEEALRTVGGV